MMRRCFLKRLRKRVGSFRYFLVGEYGGENGRPHFHVALFGVSSGQAKEIAAAWSDRGTSFGFVHVGSLTLKSARYVAKYCLKKMTARGDPRLEGKPPEFATMSLRPGIGAKAMLAMAGSLMTDVGSRGLQAHGDIPTSYRIEGKLWPLGRYLSGKLREEVGWSKTVPRERSLQLSAERLVLRADLKAWKKLLSRREAHGQQAAAKSRLNLSKRKLK